MNTLGSRFYEKQSTYITSRPDARVSLARSPHPYHRRSLSVVKYEDQSSHDDHRTPPRLHTGTVSRSESSESGTEADDERGLLLRGLPAPPVRARKGLRGGTPFSLTPAISPLPTPPAILYERRSSFFDLGQPTKDKGLLDEDHKKRYDAYIRRKRGEIVRRCAETALLCATGLLTWSSAFRRTSDLALWRNEIAVFLMIPFIMYTLYPVRRTIRLVRRGRSLAQALQSGWHVPSRFDPGPLLYPVFLPLIISVSLFDRERSFIPMNIVIGLASLAQCTIPEICGQDSGHLHWLLSLMPLHVSRSRLFSEAQNVPLGLKTGPNATIGMEQLALVVPLHQSLKSVIFYLTTTSLDVSELELLSAAMLNLLVFAGTPQTQILKALLWIGALFLFLACRHVLAWEVALARTPTWKFAHRKAAKGGWLCQWEHAICALIFRSPFSKPRADSSDSDDGVRTARSSRNRIRSSRLVVNGTIKEEGSAESASATEVQENGLNPHQVKSLEVPVRRNTFSAFENRIRTPQISDARRRKGSRSPHSFFMSLTFEQAQARKHLYALYTYAVVIGVILVPVRYYISQHALLGNDPFGWALGYLFGNLPSFRFWAVSNNLERWICLPARTENEAVLSPPGIIEDLRQNFLGPANMRLALCGYCVIVLVTGVITVLQLSAVVEVDTRRKVFHGVMVAMLLPTIFVDPCFIALALALILAIFLLLDLFRASQLPPISRPLTNFLAPYVDGRDHRGPVVVSHMFLLVGCAIPLWLSLAGATREGHGPWLGWDTPVRDLSMVSGVICVGMGDAAASLIGRRFGRTKWYWRGGKSLEGSAAFAIAVTCGLMASHTWLRMGGWLGWEDYNIASALMKSVLAGIGGSLLESTLTAANDNVVVPVGLWLLVRGLEL